MAVGTFARLRTAHGGLLAQDRASGEVIGVVASDSTPESLVLTAYLPRGRSDVCFLISSEPGRLYLAPGLDCIRVLPLGMVLSGTGTLSLHEPDAGLWVTAAPPSGDPPRGRVAAGALGVDAYERLLAVPISPVFLASEVLETATRLEALLEAPFGLGLVRALRERDGALLEAICRLAPLHELARLAEALLASPEDCRRLGALFPGDVMAQHGLPALADWLRQRSAPPRKAAEARPWTWASRLAFGGREPAEPPSASIAVGEQILGQDFDALASLGTDGAHVSLAHTCTALARRSITPTKELCVIATARNEGPYLLEWLAYHRAIGVQATFLYSNDNDDGSDRLLGALARAGAVHWMRSEVAAGGNAQGKAYGHALGVRPDVLDYRWAAVIDIDEYLMFDPLLFRSAPEFLRVHEADPCDAIALNWVVHSSNGEARWRDGLIADRFPHLVSGVGAHIKTICRPRQFIHSKPHHPLTFRGLPANFRAANLAPHLSVEGTKELSLSAHPTDELAWISHYFYKSSEEFLWKWSRNRGDHATLRHPTNAVLTADFVRNFMQQFEVRVPARAGPLQCAPGWAEELAALKALPGVAAAFEAVKAAYAERMRTIVPMFRDAPGIREAGEAGRAFLTTLGMEPG